MLDPRLVHYTLHQPTLFPLPGAKSIVTSGSVKPSRDLLSARWVGKDCAILKEGHRNILRIETFHVTGECERNVAGVRWQD